MRLLIAMLMLHGCGGLSANAWRSMADDAEDPDLRAYYQRTAECFEQEGVGDDGRACRLRRAEEQAAAILERSHREEPAIRLDSLVARLCVLRLGKGRTYSASDCLEKQEAFLAAHPPPPPPERIELPFLGRPRTLLVTPLVRSGPVAPEAPAILGDLLLSELHKLQGFETHSVGDVEAMLSLEKQKDLLGCGAPACLSELAGAFGAELLLYGQVGTLGGTDTWTVSIIEPGTARVAARASVMAAGGQLATRAPDLVAELVAEMPER